MGPQAPRDSRHQGNKRNPSNTLKLKESLLIHARTHPRTTRDHPRSRRTTFHSISQNKSKHHTKGTPTDRRTNVRTWSINHRIHLATGSRTQEPLRLPGLTRPPPPMFGRIISDLFSLLGLILNESQEYVVIIPQHISLSKTVSPGSV